MSKTNTVICATHNADTHTLIGKRRSVKLQLWEKRTLITAQNFPREAVLWNINGMLCHKGPPFYLTGSPWNLQRIITRSKWTVTEVCVCMCDQPGVWVPLSFFNKLGIIMWSPSQINCVIWTKRFSWEPHSQGWSFTMAANERGPQERLSYCKKIVTSRINDIMNLLLLIAIFSFENRYFGIDKSFISALI